MGPSLLRSHTCTTCQRCYAKAEHLLRHERTHTKEKPFVCPVCRRSFARQDSLVRHRRVHLTQDHSVVGTAESSTEHEIEETAVLDATASISMSNGLNTPSSEHRDDSTATFMPDIDQPMDPSLINDFAAFDHQLEWPESEHLLQSILASDLASWSLPFDPLPLASASTSTFTDVPFSVSDPEFNVPSGRGGHRAVQDLSRMINNIPNSVAVDPESFTSIFLDQCFHEFFESFLPTFPVIHRPTFVFRECSHPLLLNAIALGSLFLTRKDALAKGEALWRLAHTAVATSWQTLMIHQGRHDSRPGSQLVLTAVLGQAYAMLSGNPSLRTTSHVFHPLGIAWALHCGLHEVELGATGIIDPLTASEEEKTTKWKSWAANMTAARALLAHYILDGQLSHYSGRATGSRHTLVKLDSALPEAIFEAGTAAEWIELMSTTRRAISFREVYQCLFAVDDERCSVLMQQVSSSMSWTIMLEGLQSLAMESRESEGLGIGLPPKKDIHTALIRVYGFISSYPTNHLQSADALIRWQLLCLEQCVSISQLCRALCQEHQIPQNIYGPALPSGPITMPLGRSVRNWTLQVHSGRAALMHAVAIQTCLERLRVENAHGMVVPAAIFAATTVLAAFAISGTYSIMMPKQPNWAEVLGPGEVMATNPSSDTMCFLTGSQPSSDTPMDNWSSRNFLYDINTMQSLLRRLCIQWRIAVDMDQIIDKWTALCQY